MQTFYGAQFFSLPNSLFGTRYNLDDAKNVTKMNSVYPFGIDPSWRMATNELEYSNSMKMKLSIILGFIQMFTGLIISYFNMKHFKEQADIWLTFIPQVLFTYF